MRAVWLLLVLATAAPAAAVEEPGLPSPQPSYARAYVAGGLGLALTGLSFWLADEADRAYSDYESGSDPAEIQSAYDQTVRLDRLSAAALIAGQAGIALGIYWRFLDKPAGASLAETRRSPRFEPLLYPGGVAVRFRF